MATMEDFKGGKAWWCAGCGDFGVLNALQKACVNAGLEPHEVVLVSGIGCSGKITSHFRSYGFHGIHGRTLPIATGIKLANRELTVIAAGGDGDGYAIGLSHFIHAMRRNIDVTYVVMDNNIYGLTTGQTSPTSRKGFRTKTSPAGSVEEPVRPLELALASGISYLAQGFSGDVKQLTKLIEGGIKHKGFALINVFSPCVTFNKENTYDYYREHVINLDEDPGYDRSNRAAAMAKVIETGSMCRGLVFQDTERTSYDDALFKEGAPPLALQDLAVSNAQWEGLLAELR